MRARRWTSKVPNLLPVLFLSLAVVCAIIIVICAEGKQKHDAARAEEKERLKLQLVKLLQQDQVVMADYLRRGQEGQSSRPSGAKRRGMIICAGGNKLLINVYVSLKVLRNTLKSRIPVEIYHNGPQDIGPITRAAFMAFPDVRFVDLSTLSLPSHHRKPKLYNGYVQKILSLYLTRFQEVLMLDADSQPLKDPLSLFESKAFKEHGNLFWPDFWKEGNSESPHAEIYQWLGLTPPWESRTGWQCAESGQVFIDKTRHRAVMEWLWFLNSHADLLYNHMLGDKDTFEMAFMLAGKHADFYRIPISPGVPLTKLYKNVHRGGWRERLMLREEADRYFRVGMLQYDTNGTPAFIHRTERTKFANWQNGYPLDMMRPKLFIPSFGPEIPSEAKAAAWNLHSIPKSMAAENCTCCPLNGAALAVVKAAASLYPASQEPFSYPNLMQLESNSSQGCNWSEKGVSMPKFPLYPVSYFGKGFSNPLDAGFGAYTDLQAILGPKLKWTLSP